MNAKEIVLNQINEYNNQDIEKCLSYYANGDGRRGRLDVSLTLWRRQ